MNINGIFNPQNKFFMFMEKVLNLCLLGILWGVFSLPVVTAGASTAALFHYTLQLTRDEEGYVWKTFWKGFKKNFVSATLLWIAAAAVGVFLIVDLYGCQFLPFPGGGKWAVRVLLISLIFVYLLTMIYVFPLTAFFQSFRSENHKRFLYYGYGKPLRIGYNSGYLCNLCGTYLVFYRAVYDLVCFWKLSVISFFAKSLRKVSGRQCGHCQ